MTVVGGAQAWAAVPEPTSADLAPTASMDPTATTPAPTDPTTDVPASTAPGPTQSVAPVETSSAQPSSAAPVPAPTDEPSATTSSEPVPTQTVVHVPWTRDPAVASSAVPTGAVVIAVLVLVLAGTALLLAIRRRRRLVPAAALVEPFATTSAIGVLDTPPDAASVPVTAEATAGAAGAPPPDVTDTVLFLMVLGEAMIDSSAPVVQVNQTLERVAAVNGLPDVEIVALPTALLVSVQGQATTQTAASSAGWRTLRLDQVQDVLEVADLAETGQIDPAEGTARVRTAESSAPPYPGWAQILGYVGVAAGLAMTLRGSLLDVLVASVLGAVIAGVQVGTARLAAAYQALVVLACAFLVSAAVFLVSRTGLDVGTLAPLAGPLVTFLPGALLTTAAIDLATRQMIAGSARLAAGGMQLVLLALGVTGGAAVVGVPAGDVGATAAHPLGWAAPWLGVLVYGVGVVFTNCARRTALPWIVLVLVVAYAGQVLGGLLVGGVFSAFVGALVMTPVAMFVSTRPTGPPALVGFLPGFWLLVPGALGLVGVTSFLEDEAQALATVVNAGTTMVAISLGVLAGIALGSAVGRRAGVPMGRL